MKNYKKLIVNFDRHNNVVICEIMQMDERLRGGGTLYHQDGFLIVSRMVPEIGKSALYIGGLNTQYNNCAVCLSFATVDDAKHYIEKAQYHIAKFNGFQKQELDETEHQYLEKLINMIPAKVLTIAKRSLCRSGKALEFISIRYEDGEPDGAISLPLFKRGKMYKGMTQGKKYSLEELGLGQDRTMNI